VTIKSTAQVVTLTNNGGATLTGIAITLGGTNAANFADTTTCTATLAAGANCTISVTFTPTVVGPATAMLSIADNAIGSPQTIALNGTGELGSPTDVVTPNPIAFTTPQLVGVASAALPVTLSNATGTGALVISSITFGGANTTDFTQTNNCGTTVAVGATCTINVVFDPTSVTPPARTATLIITDNAADSPQSVAVTGTAIAPAISLTPGSLTFASQALGTQSAPQTVTIKNTGTAPLSFTGTGITIGGANAGDFAIVAAGDTCSTSLAPAATCSFNVVYNPAAAGTSTASIVVADNVLPSPQLVSLSGTAVATPGISFTSTSLTFASQTVGTPSAPQSVTIKNTGSAPLSFTGTGITIGGANAGDFAIVAAGDTCSAPLPPTATCSFSVVFNPTAAGARAAMIVVSDNIAGSPQTIALSGSATPASLTLNLGAASGSSLSQTVTAGQTANYGLQISANENASVTFTCSGAPTAAICSVPTTAVAVTAGTPAAVAVTISTTARGLLLPQSEPATRMQPPVALQMLPLSVLAVLLLIVTLLAATQSPAGRLRFARVALSACLVLMPIVAATLLVGCGGGSSSSGPPPVTGTPAGTYTIAVTATSGSTTTTTQLTLVVQ